MKKTKKAKPRFLKRTFTLDPAQGAAFLVRGLDPPPGYVFVEMQRRGRKVVITYECCSG